MNSSYSFRSTIIHYSMIHLNDILQQSQTCSSKISFVYITRTLAQGPHTVNLPPPKRKYSLLKLLLLFFLPFSFTLATCYCRRKLNRFFCWKCDLPGAITGYGINFIVHGAQTHIHLGARLLILREVFYSSDI